MKLPYHSEIERQALAEMRLRAMIPVLLKEIVEVRKIIGGVCSRCHNRTTDKITIVKGRKVCAHCL